MLTLDGHKDLQGGGWDLLNTKVLSSDEITFVPLLYFKLNAKPPAIW